MYKMLVVVQFVWVLAGCAGGTASCTKGTGVDQVCYALNNDDSEDVDNLEGSCPGTFAETDCPVYGAQFSCTNTVYNFFVPEAANEIRATRYDDYLWNPAAMAGQVCESTGGTWLPL